MCREVVKEPAARRYNPESVRIALQEDLDQLEAFAQSYIAMRMANNPDAQAAQHRLEAIAPRNLVSYFDLVT
jgi:hypothetical protein